MSLNNLTSKNALLSFKQETGSDRSLFLFVNSHDFINTHTSTVYSNETGTLLGYNGHLYGRSFLHIHVIIIIIDVTVKRSWDKNNYNNNRLIVHFSVQCLFEHLRIIFIINYLS